MNELNPKRRPVERHPSVDFSAEEAGNLDIDGIAEAVVQNLEEVGVPGRQYLPQLKALLLDRSRIYSFGGLCVFAGIALFIFGTIVVLALCRTAGEESDSMDRYLEKKGDEEDHEEA